MKKIKKRKIAIIAGSRGEYGYFRPIIKEIEKNQNLDYGLIVTNMHLLDTFGYSIDEIKKDKFKIHSIVHNTLDGYNHITMVKSLSIFMIQLPEILQQMGADIILISGDRGEQLMASIVGAHMYIPVAHIQAGEVTGNIDGVSRHAITKFAHIHFTANQDATSRVLKMGEEKHRVFNVGAPMLDELINGEITDSETICKKYKINKNQPTILFVFHPVTEEFLFMEKYMDEIMKAVCSFKYRTIIILNNSDAGSKVIRRKIQQYKTSLMSLYSNLPRADYGGLMSIVSVMVGNSSSAIIEAPTFKLPAVNIGNREEGRTQSTNIINVGYDNEKIKKAIKKAISYEFRKRVSKCINPYGDGKSAKRIVDVLENINIDSNILVKKLTY